MQIHDFDISVVIGDEGERLFSLRYPQYVKEKPNEWCAHDFLNPGTGRRIEVKTEDYKDSPNIFLEVFSNWDKKTVGGVFRSDGIFAFCHQFPKDKKAYWYRPEAIKSRLESLGWVKEFKNGPQTLHMIKNKTHITMGWKVPLVQVIDLCKVESW